MEVCPNGIFLSTLEFDGLSPTLKSLGAQWDRAGRRWCLRPEQAGALADLFLGLPAKVVTVKECLGRPPMPHNYAYEVSPVCIFVSGPRNRLLQDRFRKREGRWDPDKGRWWFQLKVAARLAEDLKACAAGWCRPAEDHKTPGEQAPQTSEG